MAWPDPIGVYWHTSDGTTVCHLLELATTNGWSEPVCCNLDGSIIYGNTDAGPARWDNGVLTLLASNPGITFITYCSQDGSVVAGDDGGVTGYGYWTSGGAVSEGLLSPAARFTSFLFGNPVRTISDDGSIIIGKTDGGVTYWTNGVATVIEAGGVVSCSKDGTMLVGTGPDGFDDPCYWLSGTRVDLTFFDSGSGLFFDEAKLCSGDKSRIYGNSVAGLLCYWDSLGTSGSFGHGVTHMLSDPGINANLFAISDTNGIAVGSTNMSGTLRALKWNDTTATTLPLATGWTASFANFVSADGSVVAGGSSEIFAACYWDASNTPFDLFVPPDFSDSSVRGISKDGTTIFGALTPPVPPPPPPQLNCYWTLADNKLHFLEVPAGGSAQVATTHFTISSDGTIIVGIVFDSLGNIFPAMWVNGVLHELPIPGGVTGDVFPDIVSPNGSVIAGHSGDGNLIMWTSAGTVATVLPQIPNSSFSSSSVDCLSDDGSIIAGTNIDSMSFQRVAVYWTNGTGPTALPNARANSSAFVADCNSTGAVIVGATFSTDGGEFHLPIYWTSGVERDLTTGIWGGGTVVQVTSDGTIMLDSPSNGAFGPTFPGPNDQYYWSGVGSVSGGFYGTLNQYSTLGGFSTFGIGDLAKGVNVTVGVAYNSNGVDNVGVRWTGSTPAMLATSLAVAVPMIGIAVSSDGTIVAGAANTLDFSFGRAGYWNSLGNWTTLQVLNASADTQAAGISRSGSVIYGFAAFGAVDADLTLSNFGCVQSPVITSEVTLRWSDTRGASWAYPIIQTLGDLGEYSINVNFRRLGMARDRVFEVSWSTDGFTALTGAFITFDIAAT